MSPVHPSVIYDVDSSWDDDSSCDDDSSPYDENMKNDIEVFFNVMQSISVTRSFICPTCFPFESEFPFGLELLRVIEFEKESSEFPKEILNLVNLRYLALDRLNGLPSSISKLWNLRTLIASNLAGKDLPSGIWYMTHLRHIKIGNCYVRVKRKKSCVLENLQTLSGVMNFKCKKKVISRISNLRRLKTTYDKSMMDLSCYHLYNLDKLCKLCKLESLSCHFDVLQNEALLPNETLVENLSFLSSLKKLTLRGCQIPWEHMMIIGKLPNLEVLKLQSEAFRGPIWEPNEGEFVELNFLYIEKPVGFAGVES